MSKHTPGPWDAWIHKSKFWITGPAAADCMNAINAVRDEPYCVGGSAIQIASESMEAPAIAFGDNKETAEANARLIAAAPELLDALQDCLKFLENDLFSEKAPFFAQIAQPEIRKAHAAIDKANGTADD